MKGIKIRFGSELTPRETLKTKPETLPIINENFNGIDAFIIEKEESAIKRVSFKDLTANRGKSINTFAKIYGFIGDKDSTLRS